MEKRLFFLQGASDLQGPRRTYFNAAFGFLFPIGLRDCIPHYTLQNKKLNKELK